MSATQLTSGFRRLLGAIAATGALVLVLAGTAFADNGNGNGGGNGNGCDAPGHAYGHDNCDPPADPPPPPPPPEAPATPPAEEPPAEEPSIETEPAGDVAPAEGSDNEEQPAPPEPDEPDGSPESTNTSAPETNAAAPSAPSPAPPSPGPPVAGWAPVVGREQSPAVQPAPQPTARRGRTFSSTSAPDASWGASQPDASWGASEANARDYGITGTGAVITIRRSHGVFGGLSFRVSMKPGSSTFAFRAARSVVAGSGGRLYRIGAWLRSDVPGLTVCLRIQEVSLSDPLTSLRTSESCLAPAAKWKRFRLFRPTLASGNRLVFSIYSYGATAGDNFEVDGFTVARRVKNGWKRVHAAFGDAADLR